MKYIKVVSDSFTGIATEPAYQALRLQMSTGEFHTHKAKPIKVPGPRQKAKALTLDALLHEERMLELAKATGLHFDRGGDNRMHFDSENIHVFANLMSEAKYDRMEDEISKAHIKGRGYEVYAWNDCSGYAYWKQEGEHQESNYIQVTVSVTAKDPSKVSADQIKNDVERVFGRLCGWNNVDAYYARRTG